MAVFFYKLNLLTQPGVLLAKLLYVVLGSRELRPYRAIAFLFLEIQTPLAQLVDANPEFSGYLALVFSPRPACRTASSLNSRV
jgi:hypothetical protein